MIKKLIFKPSDYVGYRDKDGYLVLPKEWDDKCDFEIDYNYELMRLNLELISDDNFKMLLNKLRTEFLDSGQIDLYPTYLRWDDTLKLAIELNASVEEKTFLISDFWNVFQLRKSTVEINDEYYTQESDYKNRLRKIREYYLLKTKHFSSQNITSEIINNLNCLTQKALK